MPVEDTAMGGPCVYVHVPMGVLDGLCVCVCVCVSWRHLFIGINNFPFLAARKKKKGGISKKKTKKKPSPLRVHVCVRVSKWKVEINF